jgi:hypothetical protein
MSLNLTLARLIRAVPVIIANLPAIMAAVSEVKQAVKKEKKEPALCGGGPSPAGEAAVEPPLG